MPQGVTNKCEGETGEGKGCRELVIIKMMVARLCKQSQVLEEACAKALEQVCGWSRMSRGRDGAGRGRDFLATGST